MADGPEESPSPRRKRVRPVVPYGDGGEAGCGESPEEAPSGSRPAVLFLVFVVLAIMGWFLIQNLSKTSRQQDCLMAGRKNCAPIDTSAP